MPEEAFHFSRDDYFSAFVVDGCRRMVGQEDYAAVPDFAPDTLAQTSAIDKNMSSGTHGTLATLPCLREKTLTLEILVEFIAKLHLYVPEYAPEYFPDLRVNVCHFSCFFEGSSGNKSNRLGMSDATTGVSSPAVAFIML